MLPWSFYLCRRLCQSRIWYLSYLPRVIPCPTQGFSNCLACPSQCAHYRLPGSSIYEPPSPLKQLLHQHPPQIGTIVKASHSKNFRASTEKWGFDPIFSPHFVLRRFLPLSQFHQKKLCIYRFFYFGRWCIADRGENIVLL